MNVPALFVCAPGGARFLRVQVPNPPGSGKDIAEGKGAHREDGEFELYYDDGDIFAGHVIIVSGNMEKGLYDAQFAG